MNILLVDDDIYTIEALKKSLNWEALGIENAYYAYGTSQARKIMEDVPIHILVSDIEMPKENGFALLEWIKEKQFVIQEILLTMYAEFQYAKQAIQYECFAYILKPIDYDELERVIRGAIKKEEEELRNISNARDSDLWLSSEKMRKEHFFANLGTEQIKPAEYGLNYHAEDTFLPFKITYSGKNSREETAYGRGMEEWERKNRLRRVLQKSDITAEAVLPAGQNSFCCFTEETDREKLEEALKTYFSQEEAEKNCSVSGFIGQKAKLAELPGKAAEFERYTESHFSEPLSVICLDGYECREEKYQPADFRKWEKLLQDRQMALLKEEMNYYFGMQTGMGISTYKNLYRLVSDFQQMVYSVLRMNGIVSYEMTEPVFAEELRVRARMHLTGARSALLQMAETALRLMTQDTEEKTMEDKIMEYIDQNIDQEMTRESLAEMVFLNPDYLARIFKRKTGMSIGSYILEKRMELARMYLEKTEEPVNMVAVKCGYDNFSYFTKVFKGKTNYTPKEYRKIFMQKHVPDGQNEFGTEK